MSATFDLYQDIRPQIGPNLFGRCWVMRAANVPLERVRGAQHWRAGDLLTYDLVAVEHGAMRPDGGRFVRSLADELIALAAREKRVAEMVGSLEGLSAAQRKRRRRAARIAIAHEYPQIGGEHEG